MMERPDSTPDLASVNCPALVIVGEQDEMTPPARRRAPARALPRSDPDRDSSARATCRISSSPAEFSRGLHDFLVAHM